MDKGFAHAETQVQHSTHYSTHEQLLHMGAAGDWVLLATGGCWRLGTVGNWVLLATGYCL
jgi:hypothetical protein